MNSTISRRMYGLAVFSALILIQAIAGCKCSRGNKYVNKLHNFSIIFPEDWIIKENVKGTIVIAEVPESNKVSIIKQNLNVIVDDLSYENTDQLKPGSKAPGNGKTLEKYVAHQLEGLKKFKEIEIKKSGISEIDGHKANWFEYTFNLKNLAGFKAIIFITTNQNKGYVITGIAEYKNYPEYKNIFEKIIYSLKFE